MAEIHCLEIFSPEAGAEMLSAVLALYVRHGWEELEREDGLLARVSAFSQDFILELEATLSAVGQQRGWRMCRFTTPDQDWLSAWKEFFTPVRAGRSFLVLPPWLEETTGLHRGRRQVILIEPKTAFGTGHHASTALCLRAVSDLADAGRIRAGQRFLDVGTGSGILGLGAVLLGLTGIGVDPDRVAVENALENRALNKAAPAYFELRRGSLDVVPEKNFDLILANILAEPLMEMAGGLAGRLNLGGALVLSGILRSQAGEVTAACREQGLILARRTWQGEWAALLFDHEKR